MYAQINVLRAAIRSEGTEAIQAAWDAVEEHIDFVYSRSRSRAMTARHDPMTEETTQGTQK